MDNPVNRGPHIKGHRVAFPAGLLCSVGDLGRSVVQPADHRQQERVVDCGQVMSCGRITRAGERAKLLEAAYRAARVPLPTVEHSEGEVGQDRGLEITGRCRGRGSLVGRRAPFPTLVVHRQVVGQPRQMPCPGDLADVAQLQRSTILLDAPLCTVLIERRQAQPNLGLLFGRRHLRERRNGQLFGLLHSGWPG